MSFAASYRRDLQRRFRLRMGLRLVVVSLILLVIGRDDPGAALIFAAVAGLVYLFALLLWFRSDVAADLFISLGDLPVLFGMVHLPEHDLSGEAFLPAWLLGTTVVNLRRGHPTLVPLYTVGAWAVAATHAIHTERPFSYLLLQTLAMGIAGLVAYAIVLERRSNRNDALTGVLVRRAGLEELERLREREGLTLAFIDLTGFKEVNDRYGHRVGDEVLSIVARRLRTSLRGGDVLFRYGGDEFIAASEAPDLEERLRGAFDAPVRTSGGSLRIEARIGLQAVEGDLDLDAVVQAADRRMYAERQSPTG